MYIGPIQYCTIVPAAWDPIYSTAFVICIPFSSQSAYIQRYNNLDYTKHLVYIRTGEKKNTMSLK